MRDNFPYQNTQYMLNHNLRLNADYKMEKVLRGLAAKKRAKVAKRCIQNEIIGAMLFIDILVLSVCIGPSFLGL